MLAYIMVGTNNVKQAAKFYDAALAPLGLARAGGDDRYVGYGPKGKPGPRPAGGTNYVAYARDSDGNKICAYLAKAK